MSLLQNPVSFDRLLRFLRLKPYETAFLKVAVPKLKFWNKPHISVVSPVPGVNYRTVKKARKYMTKPLVSNIVVAISGSGASILAAKYAIIMAKQYRCRLSAVNVVDTDTIQKLFLEKFLIEEEAFEYERCMEDNGRRFLNFVDELAAAKGLKIETELRRGAIFTEITNAAYERDSDLIILGGWKKGRSSGGFLSGIQNEITLRAGCSVLVTKDPKADIKYRSL
jgi:nucleotide-binding universal stress UspA family protein